MDTNSKITILPSKSRRELPKTYKTLLMDLEAQRLKEEIKISAPPYAIDKIIEARIHGKVFLLRRYVKCGKGCKGCPHGPYWYGFYRHKGRFISFYAGKILPKRFERAKKVHIVKDKFLTKEEPHGQL